MEIVKASKEEFGSVVTQRGPNGMRPENAAMLKLEPGQAIRIKNHAHKKSGSICLLVASLFNAAVRHHRKVSCRHDGADLLVMRVK